MYVITAQEHIFFSLVVCPMFGSLCERVCSVCFFTTDVNWLMAVLSERGMTLFKGYDDPRDMRNNKTRYASGFCMFGILLVDRHLTFTSFTSYLM